VHVPSELRLYRTDSNSGERSQTLINESLAILSKEARVTIAQPVMPVRGTWWAVIWSVTRAVSRRSGRVRRKTRAQARQTSRCWCHLPESKHQLINRVVTGDSVLDRNVGDPAGS
jgi:hypothetical protein